jgi:urease accessory protein
MTFLLWQLIDSGFPAGAFGHSGGVEAGVQHGAITGGPDVLAFARQSLAQSGRGALPLVTAAHSRPSDLPHLDGLSDVFLSNAVANRASRAQGRAFLTGVTRSFPRGDVERIDQDVRQSRLCCHYAPLYGVVFAALAIDLIETQRAFLFTTIRGVTSAAVRVGVIAAYEAQEVQTLVAADIDGIIERSAMLSPADIAQTAPLIDLRQSTHDRLYSRLFQS